MYYQVFSEKKKKSVLKSYIDDENVITDNMTRPI